VKGAFGYYLFRALFGLFGVLPERVVRGLGYGIGYLASFVAVNRLRMAERHQRRVLGGAGNTRRAARKVFAYYGRYMAEVFWLRPRRRRFLLDRAVLDNPETLASAVASDRGLILAVGHLGNWDVAGLRAAAAGARVLAVAEALPNERIVQWWIGLRNMMDIDVVIARKGARVTHDLMRRLEAGGTVALVCDRDLKGTGIPVEFFGEETTMPAGPLALAIRSGAVVLPVGTYFRKGAGHRFVVYPPLEIPEGETIDERVRRGTQALADVFETIIRAAPQQWHLIVPNWPSDKEVW
jgi:lauroyl/myristoyl acyltransferase